MYKFECGCGLEWHCLDSEDECDDCDAQVQGEQVGDDEGWGEGYFCADCENELDESVNFCSDCGGPAVSAEDFA